MKRIKMFPEFYRLACNLGLRNCYHLIHKDDTGKELIKLFNQRVDLDTIERKSYNQCVNELITAR